MEKKKKMVLVKPETHRQVKTLAAEQGRKINCDLLDDLVMLGIEDYRRAEKNLTKN